MIILFVSGISLAWAAGDGAKDASQVKRPKPLIEWGGEFSRKLANLPGALGVTNGRSLVTTIRALWNRTYVVVRLFVRRR